jgi:hypothetical protein
MGIIGKIKTSSTLIASKTAPRRSSTARSRKSVHSPQIDKASPAPPDLPTPEPDEIRATERKSLTEPTSTQAADTSAALTIVSTISNKNFTSPPSNISVHSTPSNVSGVLGSFITNGSDDIVKSKKRALLAEDEQHIENQVPDITENKSILSNSSSYIKSQLSINNSTIATNTLSMSGDDNDYSLGPDKIHDLEEDEEEKSKLCRMSDTKVMERVTAVAAAMLAFWYNLSKITQVALVSGAAIGAVIVVVLTIFGTRTPAFPAHINVAFVGNSNMYVNDLPRFVQNIGGGHISQDSVIRNSAGILNIIMKGNGMYKKWATKKAMINGVKFEQLDGNTAYLYDMGACSVPQLLTGHDDMISKANALGTFVDDGTNPCFQDEAYREYQESFTLKIRGGWDFVVIGDQSKNMINDEGRKQALTAFNYTYGPLLRKKHISPIIVQPHASFEDGVNSTSITHITTFTALIMEGAQIYKNYINRRTGLFSHAHIAPVGNAFMTVFEESQFDLYPKLFLNDETHPSAYGTFLYGTVIYATITGYMPKYNRVVIDDLKNSPLFATARKLQASSSDVGYPTKEEAAFLYNIAKKVALRGYKPKALRGFKVEASATKYLEKEEEYNIDYEGDDYSEGQQNYYNMNNNYSNNQNGAYQNNNNNNGYHNNGDQQQQYNNYNGWSQNAAQQYYNDYQQSQQYQSGYPGNSYNNDQYNGGSFYGN